MPSRRDQVQSYQFFVQRMTSALVAREPDPAAAPFQRLGGAALGGIMVAVVFLAAVGVYGLLFPGGSTNWKQPGTLILEKETGQQYLYSDDGRLHPVLNYASALLVVAASQPPMVVSRNSLVGTPRGPRIGIPDAPNNLPDPKRMLGGEWALCSQPAHNEANELVPTTVLTVGRPPEGGHPLGDNALLTRDSKTNRLYLVWRDHRHEIQDEGFVLSGLAMTAEQQYKVGGAWLNALPAGEKIATRKVLNRGNPFPAIEGGRVGQVFKVESQAGAANYFLAESAGLLQITQWQADILMSDPETKKSYPGTRASVLTVDAASVAAAPKVPKAVSGTTAAPAQRPAMVRLSGERPVICGSYKPGSPEPTVLLDANVQSVKEPVHTAEQTGTGIPLADRVVVAPGYGALVSSLPSPDAPAATWHLVTDLGFRYPLASEAVATQLGYSGVTPIKLPSSLVVRLPSGPALDPDMARKAIDPE